MYYRIKGANVPHAYEEFLWSFKDASVTELSRNGPVMTIPMPMMLQVDNPCERVLFDAARDANPFFHVMEFVWMMSGSPYLDWIVQFNKQIAQYSDDGFTLPASYGFRWRSRFGFDQLERIVYHLKEDPESRRAVLAMWNPETDLMWNSHIGKDKPCNTHIFFRIMTGHLHMTVCNRSNDAIWGMFGTNIVHMTYLQELIASSLGIPVGNYWVMTNNLHVYANLPRIEKIMAKPGGSTDYYKQGKVTYFPLLWESDKEEMRHLTDDCDMLVSAPNPNLILTTRWARGVALPMRNAYLDKPNRKEHISRIVASDWRVACEEWVERRQNGE